MKYFSMFTGVGGFELGIKKAYDNQYVAEKQQDGKRRNGFIDERELLLRSSEKPPFCVGVCEIDKYSSELLEQKFKGVHNYGDATKIIPEELPDFDLLVGGFPCQAFSIAGKRRGFEDTRGTLFFDVARVLKVKQPRKFVLENVKGLLNHDGGNTFTTILKTIDELGYDAEWQVLNSKHFGVPQNRERVFIVGHLRGTSRKQVFPIKQSNGKNIILNKVIGKVKVRKHNVNIQKLKDCLRAHKKPIKEISEALNIKSTTAEHWFRNDSCFSIPEADIWFKLKELLGITTTEFDKYITEFEIRDNKFDQANRIYDCKGISPTITTLTGGHQHTAIDDGYSIRRLTPVECERLQGFPDDWTKGFSDAQRYKMMGNAVTTNVVAVVIDQI